LLNASAADATTGKLMVNVTSYCGFTFKLTASNNSLYQKYPTARISTDNVCPSILGGYCVASINSLSYRCNRVTWGMTICSCIWLLPDDR